MNIAITIDTRAGLSTKDKELLAFLADSDFVSVEDYEKTLPSKAELEALAQNAEKLEEKAAPRRRGRPAKKAEQPAPEPVEEAVEETPADADEDTETPAVLEDAPEEKAEEPAETEAEQQYTLDDVVAAATKHLSNGGRAKVMAALEEVGSKKVKEIDPAKYGTFIDELEG